MSMDRLDEWFAAIDRAMCAADELFMPEGRSQPLTPVRDIFQDVPMGRSSPPNPSATPVEE
jgi:hypothetical protein